MSTERGQQTPCSVRLGPRPLGLHIAQAEQAWRVRHPDRLRDFFQGIKAYRAHPYRRQSTARPSVWRHRRSVLLDYGVDENMPVLVVPSLINRGYIFDLMPGVSLLDYLADGGMRPFLLEWGEPGSSDRRQSLDDYVLDRLEGALDWVLQETKQRPIVLGYCMGGTLATALACRRQDDCSGLALLATPWDFRSSERAIDGVCHALALASGMMGSASIDLLQTLFAAIDPMAVPEKFAGFSKLGQTSETARHFVALEDWLNDGIALGADIAAMCFREWYGSNKPAGGQWKVAGQQVRPATLTLPTLFAIPHQDRIVPPESALALAAMMPEAKIIRPLSGHIGMIAGRTAKKQLWTPLLAWLLRIAAVQKNC